LEYYKGVIVMFSLLIGKKTKDISKYEVECAISQFLQQNNKVSYRVLINDDYTINYQLLRPFLKCVPNNSFLMTKQTFEILEDTLENKELVQLLDDVQLAVDKYILEKEKF